MTQQALTISVMQETSDDQAPVDNGDNDHLAEASKYIGDWLADNADNPEVVGAAMEWARKHGIAEHNGYVLAVLLLLEERDNDWTLLGVRWLTAHSSHPLAPEIVVALTRKS
jgi:hypothetical protein